MKVFINPGHCVLNDPGAIGINGLKEADVSKSIGNFLSHELEVLGYETKLCQNDSLEEVCKQANDWDADLFISIHCNAEHNPQAYGTEIWTYHGESLSDKAATEVMNSMSYAFPDLFIRSDFSDGDVDKEAGFYVLKHTVMPAILIETAFISNPYEELFLASSTNQQYIAIAIADGISNFFDNCL